MFNNLINNVKNKITTIKEENENYNNLLKTSSHFTGLQPIPNLDNIQPIEGKITKITDLCPDINKEQALTISKLIPLSETYLTINYSKEIITNINYTLITTDKYLWIISNKNYGILPYEKIIICNTIKNNVMGKIINLNNIIIDINGTETNINTFTNILTNPNFRNELIKEKTSYLCNTIPTFQLLNKIYSGISIDNNNNIVFHSKKENHKYNITEITNYELLLDNNLAMGKRENTAGKITSMQNSCFSISIRITTPDKTFLIPILEPNSMNNKYTYKDSNYINSIAFAKEIINKLNELSNPNL